jgi:hypothetical protein
MDWKRRPLIAPNPAACRETSVVNGQVPAPPMQADKLRCHPQEREAKPITFRGLPAAVSYRLGTRGFLSPACRMTVEVPALCAGACQQWPALGVELAAVTPFTHPTKPPLIQLGSAGAFLRARGLSQI